MAGNWRRLVAAFVLGAALFTTVPLWGQDLNTLLVNFLVDLRNGTFGVTSPINGMVLSGPLTFADDNTDDIGASGATRPNEVFTGGDIHVGGVARSAGVIASGNISTGESNAIFWSSRSILRSGANGVIVLSNQAESDFGRLQFGGTTSSFPALKRNSAEIQVRVADDSAYGNIRALALYTGDGATILGNGTLTITATLFASLGTPADGIMKYCSDCTFANPCAGSGTGAFAKRLNGAWRCD